MGRVGTTYLSDRKYGVTRSKSPFADPLLLEAPIAIHELDYKSAMIMLICLMVMPLRFCHPTILLHSLISTSPTIP